MENKVRKHVDNLFKTFEQNEHTLDTKEELISNLLDRINDSIQEGMNEELAFNNAIGNLGTQSELKKVFNFKSLENFTFNYKLNHIYAVIATVIYLALGFAFDLWHPGWAVFIVAVAFSEFKVNDKKSYFIPAISLMYVFVGIIWDYWHPGWIVFPIGFVLLATMKKKYGALLLMTGAIYVVLAIIFSNWLVFSLIFVVAAALIAGRDEFIGGLWILTIAIYLMIGLVFDLWHPGWLVFGVAIALTTIIVDKSIIGFAWMSTITTYLFLGFIFGLWHPSWVIFIVAAAFSAYFDEGDNLKIVKTFVDEETIKIKEE